MKNAHGLAFDRGPDSNRTKTEDGRLIVKVSNISKAAVNDYLGNEIPDWERLGLDPKRIYRLYRDPAELKKAAPTFDKVPLLLTHKASTANDHPKQVTVGTIGDGTTFNAPFLQASMAIWDGAGVQAVESRDKYQLSCGYRYDADMTPGRTTDGVPFDGVMRNIRGNHVALVEDGRCGSDVVVGDSAAAVAGAKGRWGANDEAAFQGLLGGNRQAQDAATRVSHQAALARLGVTMKRARHV